MEIIETTLKTNSMYDLIRESDDDDDYDDGDVEGDGDDNDDGQVKLQKHCRIIA